MCAAERVQSLVTWWCAFDRRGTKEPSGEEAEEEFFNDRYQVGHIFFEENKGVDSISSSNKESHDFDGASQEQGSERLGNKSPYDTSHRETFLFTVASQEKETTKGTAFGKGNGDIAKTKISLFQALCNPIARPPDQIY